MRKFITMLEDAQQIEQDRLKAFEALADAQRGAPENAMLVCQRAIGGGVLSAMVEHIGDITHRMSEHPGFIPYCGYEFVAPKVDRCLRVLTNGYGFDREFRENLKANADYYEIPLADYTARVDESLEAYSRAHAKLRVYNELQKCARDAAVHLGQKDWTGVVRRLAILQTYLVDPETWEKHASLYDPNFT